MSLPDRSPSARAQSRLDRHTNGGSSSESAADRTLRASVTCGRNGRASGVKPSSASAARNWVTSAASPVGNPARHEAHDLRLAPVLDPIELDRDRATVRTRPAAARSAGWRSRGTWPRNSSVTCHWSGRCGLPSTEATIVSTRARSACTQGGIGPQREEEPVAHSASSRSSAQPHRPAPHVVAPARESVRSALPDATSRPFRAGPRPARPSPPVCRRSRRRGRPRR